MNKLVLDVKTNWIMYGSLLIFIITLIFIVYEPTPKPPEIGETWCSNPPNNPFLSDYQCVKIIDVKEGYVQFKRGKSTWLKSESIDWFVKFKQKE